MSSSESPLPRPVVLGAVIVGLAVVFTVHATRLALGQGRDPTLFGTMTSFGTRGSGVGQFEGPVGIFVDSAWRIYVTDARNSRLVRINDIAGSGWTTFGSHATGVNQFLFPWGIFVTPAGQVFVSDVYRIVRINDMSGSGWTTFGSPGTGVNQFMGLVGIFVSSNGQIYVADRANARIVRIDDMTGKGWTALGTYGTGIRQFVEPRDIYVNSRGQIFVYQDGDWPVRSDDMTGTGWKKGYPLIDPSESDAHTPWLWPWSLTHVVSTPAGQVFAADYGGNSISRHVPPFLPPPVLSPSDSFVRGQPPPPVFREERDPKRDQDTAAAYEGPLGDFVVTRDRGAEMPCRSPLKPTDKYRDSELYSSAWGRVWQALACPDDGKVNAIRNGDGGPYHTSRYYFVGPARVPIAAPLWRLQLLTVAGKPAIVQVPFRAIVGGWPIRDIPSSFGFQIAVIERFSGGTEPGIMYHAASGSLEEAIATATRLMAGP